MVGSKVLIKGAVAQHVIDGGEDRSGNSADGLLGPTAMAQALELGLQVADLLAAGSPGTLHERGLQPWRAFAQSCGAAFACTLVIAWAQAGPRDQMAGGGKRLMSVPISETMT